MFSLEKNPENRYTVAWAVWSLRSVKRLKREIWRYL